MRGIDRGGRVPVDIDHHVAADADDLAAGPARKHGDALSDDALERHPGKGDPREVRAHHRAHRHGRAITLVEGPARQHGNRERPEERTADRARPEPPKTHNELFSENVSASRS